MQSADTVASQEEGGLPPAVHRFRALVQSSNVGAFAVVARDLRGWMIAQDPHRPVYHFTGPESWINDPNGPIYHAGRYHLFYQFDPIVHGQRSARCWGHAVSTDLVRWEDWPVALWPDSPHDRQGVYSGNTFIDHHGRPAALYTGNAAGLSERYGMLAWSDDKWVIWQKRMIMPNSDRPHPGTPVHHDAQVWRADGLWWQLVGGTTEDHHGAAYLWSAPDLGRWTCHGNIAPAIHFDGFWELPYLLELGGRHVLMIGTGGHPTTKNPYWFGHFDKRTRRFTPTHPDPRNMDSGDYYSFNPSLVDNRAPGGGERRIMHAFVPMPPSPTSTVPYWQNAHAIPRVLTAGADRLLQEPIPELQTLRGPAQQFGPITLAAGATKLREGNTLEILATFAPGDARRCGLVVRDLPVWFEPATRCFGIGDHRHASDLESAGAICLHVFVDRSIIEVYLNGNAVTACTFGDPTRQDVCVFAEAGHAQLVSLTAWELRAP